MRIRRKGAGTAINSIVIMILIALMFWFFYWVVTTLEHKNIDMNLREAEILKIANTFYLTNRSLNFTWFISTVQTIFDAGDTSIGVEYWYNKTRDGQLVLYEPYDPPGIITDKIEDLKFFLNTNMTNVYANPIEKLHRLSSGVKIEITNLETIINYTNKTGTDIISSNITHFLDVSRGDTHSIDKTNYSFELQTNFSDMIIAGNRFVQKIIEFAADPSNYIYTSLTYRNAYYATISDGIENRVAGIVLSDGIRVAENTTTPQLFVPNNINSHDQYNGIDIAGIPDQGGLILNYNSECTFEEINDGYYYHDEVSERFFKRSFFLTVRAKDYLPALDCGVAANVYNPSTQIKFNYNNNDDMVCYQNISADTYTEIYKCGSDIPGQVSDNVLGNNDCLHNELLPSGAKGAECNYNRFDECIVKNCPAYCDLDFPTRTLTYHAQADCPEACGESIQFPGCYCDCDTVQVQTTCDYDANPCTDDCSIADGCIKRPHCTTSSPCYSASCTALDEFTPSCSYTYLCDPVTQTCTSTGCEDIPTTTVP